VGLSSLVGLFVAAAAQATVPDTQGVDWAIMIIFAVGSYMFAAGWRVDDGGVSQLAEKV
jgi:hypothetical protein